MKLKHPKTATASLDVDTQNCFTPLCPDELPVPEGTDIVDELNQQAHYAQFRVGTKDAHPVNAEWVASQEHPPLSPIAGDNMDVRWPVHCVPGTKGFELVKGLPHPTEYDFFVWKGIEPDMHPYGACYHDFKKRLSTGLIEYLRSKKVKCIIVGGLATDYCVKQSVLELLEAKFEVIVNLGACRGLDKQTTKQALEKMKQAGALIINSARELA